MLFIHLFAHNMVEYYYEGQKMKIMTSFPLPWHEVPEMANLD